MWRCRAVQPIRGGVCALSSLIRGRREVKKVEHGAVVCVTIDVTICNRLCNLLCNHRCVTSRASFTPVTSYTLTGYDNPALQRLRLIARTAASSPSASSRAPADSRCAAEAALRSGWPEHSSASAVTGTASVIIAEASSGTASCTAAAAVAASLAAAAAASSTAGRSVALKRQNQSRPRGVSPPDGVIVC